MSDTRTPRKKYLILQEDVKIVAPMPESNNLGGYFSGLAWQSSLMIIVTIIVLGWHLLKRHMVEDVELLYVGMNMEKV